MKSVHDGRSDVARGAGAETGGCNHRTNKAKATSGSTRSYQLNLGGSTWTYQLNLGQRPISWKVGH